MSTDLDFHLKGRFLYSFGTLLFLIALVILWQWLFGLLAERSYIGWGLEYGSSLLLFNALIAAIWDGLNKERLLISANPALFLSGWFMVSAGICVAFANSARSPRIPRGDAIVGVTRAVESIVHLGIGVTVIGVLLLWVLFAVPVLYFVLFVAATPVRQALQAEQYEPFAKRRKVMLVRRETQEAIDFGFVGKPVASSFAIGGLLVWLIGFAPIASV